MSLPPPITRAIARGDSPGPAVLSRAAQSIPLPDGIEGWKDVLSFFGRIEGLSDLWIWSNGNGRAEIKKYYSVVSLGPSLQFPKAFDELLAILFPAAPAMPEGQYGRDTCLVVGENRWRVSHILHFGGARLCLRYLPKEIPSPDKISLPSRLVSRFCDHMAVPHGLIIVGGSTGAGKTTTLASLIRERVSRQPQGVILIEDPIEYLQEDLPNGSTFLHQEIGRSAKSFPDALFYNFRQKPHLVLIAELREKDAAVAALDLALSGHLVVTTIHANDSIAALRRFHSYVEKVEGATESLAQALQMVIAQKLLAAGPSAPLVSLHEILLTNDAVRATIRKGPLEFDSLRLVVDNSREDGMQSYHTSIKNRIREGKLPAGFAGD